MQPFAALDRGREILLIKPQVAAVPLLQEQPPEKQPEQSLEQP
jgi:hypothetical protein